MKGIIAPSLLSADFTNLAAELRKIENTKAQWLHLDVMDGHFAPNITFGPPLVACVRKATHLFLDAHLMIAEPAKYIKAFAEAGADSITFHYEAVKKLEIPKLLDTTHDLNVKAGLSVNPATEAKEVFEFLADIDVLLVMTVNPGFAGQRFIREAADKIAVFREKAPELNIEVDGGINEETAKIAAELGANVLVAGSYVFKYENYNEPIDKLGKALADSGFVISDRV